MKLKELREKGAGIAVEMRKLTDEFNANGKTWKDEAQKAAYDKVNADYDANLAEISAQEKRDAEAKAVEDRMAAVEEQQRQSVNRNIPGREDHKPRQLAGSDGITDEVRGAAIAGFLAGDRRNERHVEAMQRCGINPQTGELRFDLLDTANLGKLQREIRSGGVEHAARSLEQRTLSGASLSTGGATIGETLIRNLEVNMLAFGGIRQVAETITTATGERMTWPTADDTSNTGEYLSESTSVGSSVDPSFAAVCWDAYKVSSKAILVPYELLEDSFVNLPTLLGQMLGERIGRITSTKYTTGSGAAEPKGIVTASTLGVTTASGTAITTDELIDLVHSIDPAYRNMPGTGFLMHDGIVKYLRKLKYATGEYIWQSGLAGGRPDTILNYPVNISLDMQSSVATGTKTVLFGHLSDYKIRRVNGVRLYRLEERYRDTDQTGFFAFVREDGNMLTNATARVKHMLQA